MIEVGLPVLSCEGCGACCRHIGTPPGYNAFFPGPGRGETPAWARRSEDGLRFLAMPGPARAELAAYHDALRRHEVRDRVAAGLPCLWYDPDTRRCRHYDWRPTACRSFERGGPDCLTLRARASAEHPGD